MWRPLAVGVALLCLVGGAAAFVATEDNYTITENVAHTRCKPMYSQNDIPGAQFDAHIDVAVDHASEDAAAIYVAIYPDDEYEMGLPGPDAYHRDIVCTADKLALKQCGVSKLDEIILIPKRNQTSAPLLERASMDNSGSSDYMIPRKGHYCITIYSSQGNTSGIIYYTFPYGNLSPLKYPYLPFYGFLGLAYGIVAAVWLILCLIYWRNILQVQIYISGITFLCMLETTFAYAYYANWNDVGEDSDVLLTIMCVLTAARNSVSLVALLVVCLGYGLVKPTLGATWNKVLGLGFINFVFGTLYTAEMATSSNDEAETFMLLVFVLPLAVTLTTFYVWTISALTETLAKLALRRQTEKMKTYIALRRVLFVSFVLLFVLIVMAAIQKLDVNYVKDYWDVAWFTADCSVTLVYFFVFVALLFLWRPRSNNIRAGMDQLATDDDDFEEVELGNARVGAGSVVSDKVKSRRGKSKAGDDEDEDPLKWVEDNIPDLLEDDGDITNTKEDQALMIRSELAKMN